MPENEVVECKKPMFYGIISVFFFQMVILCGAEQYRTKKIIHIQYSTVGLKNSAFCVKMGLKVCL
jgi:hypothetical protein